MATEINEMLKYARIERSERADKMIDATQGMLQAELETISDFAEGMRLGKREHVHDDGETRRIIVAMKHAIRCAESLIAMRKAYRDARFGA
jgi:hypothetical protein